MLKYIGRRLLWMIPIIIGVSLLVFTLIDLVPGDPGTLILGPSATSDEIEAMNEAIGYYKPFWVKYFTYMGKLLQGDFGTSYATSLAVLPKLMNRTTVSFLVALSSITASLCIGIPLGVLSAVKQYSLWDAIPSSIAMMLSALPAFWIGLMLMLELSLKRDLLPTFGVEEKGWIIMPTMTLAAVYGSTMMRFSRSSMLETIRQDYIRTARSKGVKERTVIWRHALKNALMPVITAAGNTFGALLGGAVVCETLFSLPGLGTYIVNGIKMKDIPVVMGGTIVLSVMLAFIMLAVDLIYVLIDPRIKSRYQRKKV